MFPEIVMNLFEKDIAEYKELRKAVDAYGEALEAWHDGKAPLPSREIQLAARKADDTLNSIEKRVFQRVLSHYGG
jgi:hypothetical protein